MTTIPNWALRIAVISIVASSSAAPEDFYGKHLQPGVSLGISPDDLAIARPAALKDNFGSARTDLGGIAEMSELRRQQYSASISMYRFKGDKLRAVIESTKTTKLPIEHTTAAVTELADELKANFAFQRNDQIVRSAGTVAAILTAQLWEDGARGINLYFVATNHEITLVIFDPTAFGKADFFNGPELLNKVEANNESIRRTLGERAPPAIPIIDLLATKPQSGTPVANAAPPTVSVATGGTPRAIIPEKPASDMVTPKHVNEQRMRVWPWIAAGIAALLVIVAFVFKRRVQ